MTACYRKLFIHRFTICYQKASTCFCDSLTQNGYRSFMFPHKRWTFLRQLFIDNFGQNLVKDRLLQNFHTQIDKKSQSYCYGRHLIALGSFQTCHIKVELLTTNCSDYSPNCQIIEKKHDNIELPNNYNFLLSIINY